MSCIPGDTFPYSLSFTPIRPSVPTSLVSVSLHLFPGFACTRGQINVDGAPRVPFFSPTFTYPAYRSRGRLYLSLFIDLST